jgi:hypothetical protein
MRTVIVAAGALVLMTPAAASAADKVPVTLDVTGCEGCSITASWSKKGTAQSKVRGKTKKVTDGTVSFDIPKGYWMYLTGTSPKAAVNAATIVVTQYKGSSKGATVSPKKSRTYNDGAYFCLKAKKMTIDVRAALVKDGPTRLLSLWANPQLGASGNMVQGGIKGVYGTQNTLLCKGDYY